MSDAVDSPPVSTLNFKLMTGSASVVLSYWLPVYTVVVSTPEYGDKNEWLGFGLNY
jgi:hypothetical protein